MRLLDALNFVAVALLCFGGALIYYDSTLPDSDAFRAAEIKGFYDAIPQTGCVSRDQIRAIAQEKAMPVTDAPEFQFCVAPAGLSQWLRVTLRYPLPFSTDDENNLFFGFDAQGCNVDWAYDSCP